MSTLRRIWTVPSARISIIILLGVAVLVVAGSALAPHDPLEQDPTRMLQGPGQRALARHRLPRPRRAQPA